jgi:hypothetical protein
VPFSVAPLDVVGTAGMVNCQTLAERLRLKPGVAEWPVPLDERTMRPTVSAANRARALPPTMDEDRVSRDARMKTLPNRQAATSDVGHQAVAQVYSTPAGCQASK